MDPMDVPHEMGEDVFEDREVDGRQLVEQRAQRQQAAAAVGLHLHVQRGRGGAAAAGYAGCGWRHVNGGYVAGNSDRVIYRNNRIPKCHFSEMCILIFIGIIHNYKLLFNELMQ